MSSIVLLNRDGVVAKKLALVSLPDDYVIPDGMTVSWRTELHVFSRSALASLGSPREPVEAFFYLGKTQGQVCRDGFKPYEPKDNCLTGLCYDSRILTITVQGTSAKDVMELRDRIMHLINSHATWEVSNDLNPKPKIGFLQRLKKMVKRAV